MFKILLYFVMANFMVIIMQICIFAFFASFLIGRRRLKFNQISYIGKLPFQIFLPKDFQKFVDKVLPIMLQSRMGQKKNSGQTTKKIVN